MKKIVQFWTQEENDFIINNYQVMSDLEMSQHLSGRTERSVRTERNKLKLVRPKKQRTIVNHYKKSSFEEIIQEFNNRNYILLSDESEYINKSSKLRYICKKHEDKGELQIAYGHFQQGKGCKFCGFEKAAKMKLPYITFDEDKDLCDKINFTYIKTEKYDDKYYIVFICKNYVELGEQKMTRGNMRRDGLHGCQYCSNKNLPNWYIKKEIENKYPFTVLSDYNGMNNTLKCICGKHNKEFEHDAKSIYYYGRGCSECSKERYEEANKLQDDEILKRIHKANPDLEVLDYTYSNCNSPIHVSCIKCGYDWHSPFASICANGVRCPICSNNISKGEQVIEDFLLKNNINHEQQYRIKNCKDKRTLPFDNSILNNDKKLIALVEFHDIQHYKSVEYFDGNKGFEDRKRKDKIKYNYCISNNIPLLIIPYWDFKNIKNILNDFLKKLKI